MIQCNSSFTIASCVVCKAQVDAKRVREDFFSQTILCLQVHVSSVSKCSFFLWIYFRSVKLL